MRHDGEEFRFGWRKEVDVGGVGVTIEANHSRRSRIPRGHEIARQMSRGRPMEMVEEVTHEWRVHVPGLPRATIRPNPNGSFSIDGRNAGRARTVEEVATQWAEARLPKNAEPAESAAPGPR